MSNATGCADAPAIDACSRCDVLLGLDCVHVEAVQQGQSLMTVTVSTSWQLVGCPDCGVVAPSRGRRDRWLHDVPGAVSVRLRWRQRTWRCPDPECPRGVFVEQVPELVGTRGTITTRAVAWAIGQLRREHATIAGLARQFGTTWHAVWGAIRPELERMAEDPSRFEGVDSLGVDEHTLRTSPSRRSPQAGPEGADRDGRPLS